MLVILVYHGDEQGRLAALEVILAAAVRNDVVGAYHVEEVLDDSSRRGRHVTEQQSAHDPVRVPVVEFAKPAPGDHKPVNNATLKIFIFVISKLV